MKSVHLTQDKIIETDYCRLRLIIKNVIHLTFDY